MVLLIYRLVNLKVVLMKFQNVNEAQIKQAEEACETICKLRKSLAKQRLINRLFGHNYIELKSTSENG